MSNREFQSVFKNEFSELIAVKRALGFKYESEEGGFLRIDSYLYLAFLVKGTDGVVKAAVLSLFLLVSIPDILFLQDRHTTEHVEVSGGAV